MITFILCIAALIVGYIIYGAIVEKVFEPARDKKTPAIANPDGVDYVPISNLKAFLIELLNIAGLGPIFGAISGALWGPRYTCGSSAVRFLPEAYTIIWPVCFPSAMTVQVFLK
jgi:carbon starvation protein CstA